MKAVLMNRPRIPPVSVAVLTTTELGLTSQVVGLAQYVADGLVGSYDVFRVSDRLGETWLSKYWCIWTRLLCPER